MKKWDTIEIEFVKNNYGVMSQKDIASFLNRSEPSVQHCAARLGLFARKWSVDEDKYLRENYQTRTYKELAKHLGRTKAAVDIRINSVLGLKKTAYHYCQDFFSIIDSEEKAYWLGFIAADGSVSINPSNNSCEVAIKLQGNDAEHLKKFNKAISGNVPVTTGERPNPFDPSKTYKYAEIRLYSQTMAHDLEKYNIHPNKSLDIEPPKSLNNTLFMPHYIRGYYDGNGCVIQNGAYISCDFTTGSASMAKALQAILAKNNIRSSIYQERLNTYRIRMHGLQNCDNFLRYIYTGASVWLDRKYTKKERLYSSLNIERRLLRSSEMTG
jgi:hypothetical protein